MKRLSDFISPSKNKTPPMKVEVIGSNGGIKSTFEAPAGFQLERYADSLYPESELMVYFTLNEVNVSVLEGGNITEIYKGTYK